MEDKKGILYKGGCLCGKIIFEIIRGIQENILQTMRFSDYEQKIYYTGHNSSPTWYI